jgi:hypothetical protein
MTLSRISLCVPETKFYIPELRDFDYTKFVEAVYQVNYVSSVQLEPAGIGDRILDASGDVIARVVTDLKGKPVGVALELKNDSRATKRFAALSSLETCCGNQLNPKKQKASEHRQTGGQLLLTGGYTQNALMAGMMSAIEDFSQRPPCGHLLASPAVLDFLLISNAFADNKSRRNLPPKGDEKYAVHGEWG